MTSTHWEPGTYVDGWYGHYSTARALVRAITELGWSEPESEDAPGPILSLALYYLSSMGPAPTEGSGEWIGARLREEQCRALAESEGWDLEEDLSDVLSWELDAAEEWLDSQPQTPDGHWWGHHPAGGIGWGLWSQEEES